MLPGGAGSDIQDLGTNVDADLPQICVFVVSLAYEMSTTNDSPQHQDPDRLGWLPQMVCYMQFCTYMYAFHATRLPYDLFKEYLPASCLDGAVIRLVPSPRHALMWVLPITDY